MIHPEAAGYDGARAVWNAMHDRRPALIARPRSARDVAAAIALRPRRGPDRRGAGRRALDAGAQHVRRRPGHRPARAQPGHAWIRWPDGPWSAAGRCSAISTAATQEHGLVVPAGVVSHTGVAGLTLGGGVGRLMRRFGLTIDSLVSAEVVTAGGEILRASAD